MKKNPKSTKLYSIQVSFTPNFQQNRETLLGRKVLCVVNTYESRIKKWLPGFAMLVISLNGEELFKQNEINIQNHWWMNIEFLLKTSALNHKIRLILKGKHLKHYELRHNFHLFFLINSFSCLTCISCTAIRRSIWDCLISLFTNISSRWAS